ncbi:hypothetical protein CVT91_01105 [Candidatus Atribacteria bacterium HGW-Atribacteria-1]|nr:MAG: hypothetical protein CVT91_01105 [Candidatus Atribacteria bacterium HGW-Atribacteria-1]
MNRIDEIFSYINERKNPERNKITIGKIESSTINSYWGTSYLSTALVPLFYLDKLMESEEEAGHEVEYIGPIPIEKITDLFLEKYYIRGLLNDKIHLEPLVLSWRKHNKMVYIPEPKFLMQYALVARNSDQKTYWDDPSIPRYGVIEVLPTSEYKIKNGNTLAKVEAEREYLEDYAFLKKCAIVEFYFEERWINTIEPELEKMLQKESSIMISEKNKKIKLSKSESDKGNYNLQMWGRQNILIPKKKNITEPESIILNWPGYKEKCTEEDARKSGIDYVYLKDHYLQEYENRKEFKIYPENGIVNYQGWWEISFCERMGRDYVRFELRKLYEGIPKYITKEINKFAVSKEEVDQNIKKYGKRNIGLRAKELIYSYLDFFNILSQLFSFFDSSYNDMELCSYSKHDIEYSGWHHWMELRKIGNVARHDFIENDFLDRCNILMSFFESIKEKPLRAFLKKIKVDNEKIESKKSIKLLEILMKVVKVSTSSGLTIKTSIIEILNRVNFEKGLDEMSFLYYLYDIRVYASHKVGADTVKKYEESLEFFNIDKEYMKSNGWGIAIDNIMDKIIKSQERLIEMIRECIESI